MAWPPGLGSTDPTEMAGMPNSERLPAHDNQGHQNVPGSELLATVTPLCRFMHHAVLHISTSFGLVWGWEPGICIPTHSIQPQQPLATQHIPPAYVSLAWPLSTLSPR